MPWYSFVGVLAMAVSEAAMLAHIEPFWSWHTPIAWTGYILFVDGLVFAKRHSSWLTSHRKEFWFLSVASIPLWLIFEGYNRLIENWHYINLPENLIARYVAEGWAFATIWPALFETAELAAVLRSPHVPQVESRIPHPPSRIPRHWKSASIVSGTVLLAWPILFPSNYLAPAVWLGFIFLLDPVNAALGEDALVTDLARGAGAGRVVNLAVAGMVCGIVWEFWNYWARTKWIYTVPFMPYAKIFEMPLPGYFGFPAFALECFTMYVFVRHVFWRGNGRSIAV